MESPLRRRSFSSKLIEPDVFRRMCLVRVVWRLRFNEFKNIIDVFRLNLPTVFSGAWTYTCSNPTRLWSCFVTSRIELVDNRCAKVAGQPHDQRFNVNFIIMSRHVTSCHAMASHVTSCHVMSRHVTSCHVMSRHVTSCHVMLRHVTSCNAVTSFPVTSCHVTLFHVMSRRKSRDGHTTNALLSTDFFHTQFIQIMHWLVVPKDADTIPHQWYII